MTKPALSIGFFSPGWPVDAFTNGIVTYVANVAPALKAAGHRVSVAAVRVANAGAADLEVFEVGPGTRASSLPRRIVDTISYRVAPVATRRRIWRRHVVQSIREMVAERAVQVFEMEESFGSSWWVRRATKIPMCVRLHGPWFLTGAAGGVPEDRLGRERIHAEGRAIATADAVTAPSGYVLQRVRDYYRIPLEDAEVIPNPVARVPPPERWRLERCERGRILFVGRFDRTKGGDLVVDAFAEVLARRPDARLTLVGSDDGCVVGNGRKLGLEAFVRERLPGALESRQIEWLGRQPFSALAELRRRAFLTVVCSRYETFPYTATEAMALGCPLVAARVAGIPEVVKDGVSGLLHEPGDASDLARRLLSLLEAPGLAAEMGRRAAEECERLLHPDVIAARLAAVYTDAVRRAGGRRS